MNKKAQQNPIQLIKLIIGVVVFIVVVIPILNVILSPTAGLDSLIGLLPGLIILAFFFELIRRIGI